MISALRMGLSNNFGYFSQDTKAAWTHPTRSIHPSILLRSGNLTRPQNNIHKETVCIMHTAVTLIPALLTIRRVKCWSYLIRISICSALSPSWEIQGHQNPKALGNQSVSRTHAGWEQRCISISHPQELSGRELILSNHGEVQCNPRTLMLRRVFRSTIPPPPPPFCSLHLTEVSPTQPPFKTPQIPTS